jgi:hypothetical protein
MAVEEIENGHKCAKFPADARAIQCPICQQVVPTPPNKDPNDILNRHIDDGCPNTSKENTIYQNGCNFKGCKKRELVKIQCNTCEKQFCIKHRLEQDHKCEGPPPRNFFATTSSKATKSKNKKDKDCTIM